MNLSSTLRTVGNALEVKRMMNGMNNFDPNDLLHRIGLERRRSAMDVVLPALGFIAVGAAIGAGLAVLFTPSSGAVVRRKIAKAASDAKCKVEGLLTGEEEESETEEEPVSNARSDHHGRPTNAA